MMNDNALNHEIEDFEKTISFNSGQFAIVDAAVIKGLKDTTSLAGKVIFVATKQSRGVEALFKVSARYDDATLRRLMIEPTSTDDNKNVEESIQPLGHDREARNEPGDSVKKKISIIKRKVSGNIIKTGDRDYRNKNYSKGGNPRNLLSKGGVEKSLKAKATPRIDGAKRSNYGQPKKKKKKAIKKKARKDKMESTAVKECMEFMFKMKESSITEEYLKSLEHMHEIKQVLTDIRDNNRVTGKSFDLVYESIEILNNHWRKSSCAWANDLIDKGVLDVK